MLTNGKAAPAGECRTRPVVEANLKQDTTPAPTPQVFQRRPLCRSCFFFHPIGTADPLLTGKGECWRYPPRACPQCLCADEYSLADEAGFCGEFVDRENKIATFDPATRSVMRGRS